MKRPLRPIGVLVSLAMMACLVLPAFGAAAEGTNWAAEGYKPISTAADLNELVRNNLDGKFYLTGDISFKPSDFEKKGAYYNDGVLWRPLGPTYSERFTGVFDGNGHTISGLKVAVSKGDSDSAYAGLFGYSSGRIQNLRVMNSSIQIKDSSYGYAGGIAGAAGGTITNCHVLGGSISVKDTKNAAAAGGIVGRMYAGTLTECYNSAAVSASGVMAVAGGIAGQSSATLNQGMNKGNITSKSDNGDASGGGIIGVNDGAMTNVLNMGALSVTAGADAYAGGLAGANRASIKAGLNRGAVKVTAKSHLFGGAAAGQCEGGTLESCYYLNTTYKTATTDSTQKATSLSAQQMAEQNRFSGFDFKSIWIMEKYAPTLRIMRSVQSVLTGIEITRKPTKMAFVEGQKLDTTGMVVSATYEDGTTKALAADDYVITGYDSSAPGKKTLTISYGGFTATLTVTIAQKVLMGIRIQSLPDRVVFGLGEDLDLTGGLIAAEYDNGMSINYTMTNEMVSGYDNKKLGKQTLTVTYYGKKATFEITMQKDIPPTSAKTTTTLPIGTLPTGNGGAVDSGSDDMDDNGIGFVTTRPTQDADKSGSTSLWVSLLLVLISLLAAGAVVLLELRKQGKGPFALQANARHGKKKLPEETDGGDALPQEAPAGGDAPPEQTDADNLPEENPDGDDTSSGTDKQE